MEIFKRKIPEELLMEIEEMTVNEKSIFLLSGFNGQKGAEWQSLYESFLDYSTCLIKSWTDTMKQKTEI